MACRHEQAVAIDAAKATLAQRRASENRALDGRIEHLEAVLPLFSSVRPGQTVRCFARSFFTVETTLRMIWEALRPRHRRAAPTRAAGARRARYVHRVDVKREREMREGMRDGAGNAAPLRRPREARCSRQRGACIEVARPPGRRHLGHAAEQAGGRPRAHQQIPARPKDHEGGAAAQRAGLLPACAEALRSPVHCRARLAPCTQRAGRFSGVQIVAPRSSTPVTKSPGRRAGVIISPARMIGFGRQTSSTAKGGRHALDVPRPACVPVERDRPRSPPPYRRRCRERAQARLGSVTVPRDDDHRPSSGMQIARPRVERARPRPQHIVARAVARSRRSENARETR